MREEAIRKNHMDILWHEYTDKGGEEIPVTQASLTEKASIVGRVGIMLLSCGTGAWRVRSSMNALAEEMGITCTADIGLMSIEYTCFDGQDGFSQSLCLTNTGVNTSKLPLLTEDEKKELFKEIKKGNEVAREKYIRGNLRLVLSILQRFSNSNENVDDLFQIGCIGLIKAVDNFDDTLNVKFSTYAVPMISGELKRYLRDNAAIRVSRSIKDIAYKAIYCKENIIKTTHREPTVVEVAKEIGVEPEDVVYALDAIQSPVSLYDPVYDQGGDTLYVMDQISDKKNKEEKWVENIVLNEALKGLSERERKIIDMRFFNGKTQMEIADEIGISQAQVSRLEKNALKAMKKYME